MTTLCICCNKPARDAHHPHPKSQGGTDEGEVPACRDCHSLYHSICGQQLAKTVKARVTNFGAWMGKFPGVHLIAPRGGLRPADMAPRFVIRESQMLKDTQRHVNLSGGCLSTLGKVTTFRLRRTLK